MKTKVIKGLSFGFKTVRDLWDGTTRILKELKLFEISPVTFGMHPQAVITSVKQWDEQKPFPNEQTPILWLSCPRTKRGRFHGSAAAEPHKLAARGRVPLAWRVC